MTPEQKLKHAILLEAHKMDYIHLSPDVEITDQNVDDLYACWRRPKTEPLLRVVPTQN